MHLKPAAFGGTLMVKGNKEWSRAVLSRHWLTSQKISSVEELETLPAGTEPRKSHHRHDWRREAWKEKALDDFLERRRMGHHQADERGAGIAQWLERRTRDRKVAGSNPCRSAGRIFFSRVSFLR